MLWVYDNAIVNDLINCIDPNSGANSTVRLMGEDGIMGVYAQLQEDKITFPAIFLQRHDETPIDQTRFNFTRLHKGVPAVYDPKANNIYLEKALPIELKYDLHVLTTNTVDMDEVMRELLFRYSAMYYLQAEIPYESKRTIRFGIAINPGVPIQKKSGTSQYIETGTLYESIIELDCQGAVLISYTPRHMQGIITKDVIKVMGVGEISKDSNL
jgi:hypothetical protein